jgi:hypothetical protein
MRRRAALGAGQTDISPTRSSSFPTRVQDVLTRAEHCALSDARLVKDVFPAMLHRTPTCNGPQTRSLGLANKSSFEPTIRANMRGCEPTLTANEPTFIATSPQTAS